MLGGLAEERPSVRMQGKEINMEQAGTELPRAQEARDPGEEMKERQVGSGHTGQLVLSRICILNLKANGSTCK